MSGWIVVKLTEDLIAVRLIERKSLEIEGVAMRMLTPSMRGLFLRHTH